MKHLFFVVFILTTYLLAACSQSVAAPAKPTETPVSESVPEAVKEEANMEEVAEKPTAVPTATPPPLAEEPTAEPTPEPTLAPVVLGEIISEDIMVEAADGLELVATFSAAEGLKNAPGVILLHMLGSNRTIWEQVGLVDKLSTNGYAVLALDMRGHGEIGNAPDWVVAADDIQRVWTYFAERSEVDEKKTAVIGASIGSNMALVAAANEPAVRTTILLSPGLVYRGVTTEDRLLDYGERPLLLVASADDFYSEDTVNKLAETAVGETQVQVYETAGHGTNMFEPQPDLTPLILDWLAVHLAN